MRDNLKKNASGYDDPTAYRAIIEADREHERLSKLLKIRSFISIISSDIMSRGGSF